MVNNQEIPTGTKPKSKAVPFSQMRERVAAEPKPKYIYSGIKEGSVGIIFGPSKSGKTMYTENLLQSISSGQPTFQGLPIDIENRKVLMVSFEEHYIHRTERQTMQIGKLSATAGEDWVDNFMVNDELLPTYIRTDEEWKVLRDFITASEASVVVLDSITRMCEGIEESSNAQAFMRKLKSLALQTNTTIICIHHTTKLYGAAITMDSIAGSRVIAQEVDFAIGINRTAEGKRYVKNVFFRYAQADDETVRTFAIDDTCWLNVTGRTSETKLLQVSDGRRNEDNADKIVSYLESEANDQEAASNELEKQLVPKNMSRGTLFNQLKKLKDEGRITETDGKYKLAA